MYKKIIATVITLSLAVVMIVANSVFVTYAFSNDTHNITAESTDKSGNATSSTTEVKDQSSVPEPANVMSKDEAIQIGLKAIQDKYGANPAALYSFATFCQRVDMDGDFWFVSFSPESLRTQKYEKRDGRIYCVSGGENKPYDTYFLFVNSRTGEIVEIEKNTIDPNMPKPQPEKSDGAVG